MKKIVFDLPQPVLMAGGILFWELSIFRCETCGVPNLE